MKRYAIVRGRTLTPEKVAAFLPHNYQVIWQSKDDKGRVIVVIQGEDCNGWTLNSYVIPRLGSGLMASEEIDLSHPVMQEIPVEG